MPSTDSPMIARRFLRRARIITVGTIALAVVVAVAATVAMIALGGPRDGGLLASAIALLTVVVAIVGLALVTAPRARALRVLRERHPGHVVFLARRLPSVVSDMPQYLASRGIQVEIGADWYVAGVDGEGIGVWSPGADPQRLLTIPWEEIGEVLAVRTPTLGGEGGWSVTVDVKPYAEPLTVDVGYAWGIVTMAMDAAGTADVVAAVNAQRPAG